MVLYFYCSKVLRQVKKDFRREALPRFYHALFCAIRSHHNLALLAP
jgi:hypothetical protein